ncbi:Pycsar system effector family protein [Streptomyces sp. NPDC047097]|uniref:Pycsar system effector family protein n=1 Tax=Streptomyces sp. NPDC047097 TaxID=3155260 RepID=UPI0033E22BD2
MDRDTALAAALAHTATEIARADTKAGTLLAFHGLLVTALSLSTPTTGIALALTYTAGTAIATSAMLGLLVILPRLAPRGAEPPRGSFVRWATLSTEQLADEITEDHRTAHLGALSRIAMRKMVMLRYDVFTTFVAVFCTAAAITTR